MKKISVFLSEKFQFLEVKFSIYLNRRVFVMYSLDMNIVGRRMGRHVTPSAPNAPVVALFMTQHYYETYACLMFCE